jgi:signal transduction histidine kinase
MLQVIRRNATRLMNLIEDLLTVSRLEAGTFGLNIAPTRVASIVEAARDAVQPSALSGGVELRVTECQEDCVVMADAVQLERALLNVLSNAIKFTPAGGSVHLHVSVEEDQVRLRVSDTGMGISPDDMPRLFRPFFRSSDAYKQALPGTGLGLVIVRSIMEEHKGSVDITSAPGSGTTVTLRLPALVTREPDRAPAA